MLFYVKFALFTRQKQKEKYIFILYLVLFYMYLLIFNFFLLLSDFFLLFLNKFAASKR